MALGRRKMFHQSLNPLKSTRKGQFLRDFLLFHDYIVVSSKIGVPKNSKFEFLDPQIDYKMRTSVLIRKSIQEWVRTSKNQLKSSMNIQKQGEKQVRKSKNQLKNPWTSYSLLFSVSVFFFCFKLKRKFKFESWRQSYSLLLNTR